MISKLIGVICVLLYIKLSTSRAFVIERLNRCSYNSSNSILTFTSKIWNVKYNDIDIYYTLCGYLPEEICGIASAAACLKNKEYVHVVGKQFILGSENQGSSNNFSFKAVSGNFCKTNSAEKYKFTIKFENRQDMEETRLEKKSDCEYNIYMIDPKHPPICTTKIDDQLIDLRMLKGNYFVQLKDMNFSIALCGAKQECTDTDSDISICKKYSGGVVPLSTFKNEKVVYNKIKNEVVYRGSYKGEEGMHKFELLLRCRWEHNLTQIKYKTLPTQGKQYKFIMDSLYGCVKLHSECVIQEVSLIYNLTSLFDKNGHRVSNVPSGSLYINICGPLNLKQTPENSCSRSLSQVCEVKDGNYRNRGSMLSKFEVVDDVVHIIYANGMECEEDPSRQYTTHIDLFCSGSDHGPTFVKIDKCELYINWYTSQACPAYDKSSCQFKQHEDFDCSVTFQEQRYDLSPLRLSNRGYEIDDPKNKSIKYFFNVCGSVIDPDASCMDSSMIIMKNMAEKNVKYRIKSLGKMDSTSVVNQQIVIQTISGTYCGREGDYTGEIHLICNSEEKKPKLVNKTECTFQFNWETPYGCLNIKNSNIKQCLISDLSNDISLNFTGTQRTSIKINIDKMNYVFNICKDTYTECVANHCENIHLEKNLVSNNNTLFIEMSLPKLCDTENVIDKVIFELVCNEWKNNEHFELKEQINNCTVKLLLYTHLVCGKEEYHTDNDEKEKYVVVKENLFNQEMENCSVINYNTGYKVYLSSFNLNISTVCPEVYFYEYNSSVVLTYPSGGICNKSTLGAKYEYKAVLKCSEQELHEIKKMDCFELHTVEGPKFCKLFEYAVLDTSPQTSNTVTIVCSIIGIIVFLVICLFCLYKWKTYLRKSSYLTVYEKDADM